MPSPAWRLQEPGVLMFWHHIVKQFFLVALQVGRWLWLAVDAALVDGSVKEPGHGAQL